MSQSQQWRVGNDHRFQFVSMASAERHARQRIVEQEHMTGHADQLEITCAGCLVAVVRMDGEGRVWTDLQGRNLTERVA